MNQLQKLFKKKISCLEQKSRRRTVVNEDLWQDTESEISVHIRWLSEELDISDQIILLLNSASVSSNSDESIFNIPSIQVQLTTHF